MNNEWANEELGNISLGDKRLNNRFLRIASDLSNKPIEPINKACDDWAHTKAAYRFFQNEKASAGKILKPHVEQTHKRILNYPFVLALQDTTSFNYTGHAKTKGLGKIGHGSSEEGATKSQGFYLHQTLAVAPNGQPLGLLSSFFWKRENIGNAKDEKEKDEKESERWCQALVDYQDKNQGKSNILTIADRECDFNQFLFHNYNIDTHFLVRSKVNRIINESSLRLHEFIKTKPVEGSLDLRLPNKKKSGRAKKKLKGRFQSQDGDYFKNVSLDVQFTKFTAQLSPTGHRNASPFDYPLTVIRISEKERDLEEGEELLEWILITSLQINTVEEAKLMAKFYSMRWTIEIFFKTLKSGCQVESCRLEDYKRLVRYVALFSIVSWRILWMTFLSRVSPELDCTEFLSDSEWKALFCKIHKTKTLPKKIPTVKETIIWIAKLGGFLNRKNDGPPGPSAIWSGWQRLVDFTLMWEIMT